MRRYVVAVLKFLIVEDALFDGSFLAQLGKQKRNKSDPGRNRESSREIEVRGPLRFRLGHHIRLRGHKHSPVSATGFPDGWPAPPLLLSCLSPCTNRTIDDFRSGFNMADMQNFHIERRGHARFHCIDRAGALLRTACKGSRFCGQAGWRWRWARSERCFRCCRRFHSLSSPPSALRVPAPNSKRVSSTIRYSGSIFVTGGNAGRSAGAANMRRRRRFSPASSSASAFRPSHGFSPPSRLG